MSNSKPAETLHCVGSPADRPARTPERSQGTDHKKSAPNLQRFSKEARSAATCENDRSALLEQLGGLLLEHSTCGIVFEASVPLSQTANELDQSRLHHFLGDPILDDVELAGSKEHEPKHNDQVWAGHFAAGTWFFGVCTQCPVHG